LEKRGCHKEKGRLSGLMAKLPQMAGTRNSGPVMQFVLSRSQYQDAVNDEIDRDQQEIPLGDDTAMLLHE
jgi:hypothetical protein